MKKLFFLIIFCVLLVGLFSIQTFKRVNDRILSEGTQQVTVSPLPQLKLQEATEKKRTLFVPYWTLQTTVDTSLYDRFIYFGITPTQQGIDPSDQGVQHISVFRQTVGSSKPTLLTVRMLESKTNFAILEDRTAQQKMIQESLSLAQDNGFSGIVLDLEITALPFDSVIKQINSFEQAFYAQAKAKQLYFAITLYGDTFYRIRPFDVKTLANHSDEVMLMAYDFHKAAGNPGPNFPLSEKDRYGYDFTEMLTNFQAYVPLSKMSVILGLFGYDWELGEQQKALSRGEALTYNQIKSKYLSSCQEQQCQVVTDPETAEKHVTYTAADGKHHQVWFEDPDSAQKKIEFLQTHGVGSISFWANGYF